MKVTYIHHSSFCIELGKIVLIFDYCNGKKIPFCSYSGKMPEFSKDIQMYVFSSHSHPDHFDIEVLKWSRRYDDIQYIFAKEVKKKLGNSALQRVLPDMDIDKIKEKIHYLKPEEKRKIGHVSIETLLSTDSGVAFVVECFGKIIYHAGDLNWWHWEGEPEQENRYQKETYQRQINILSDRNIDLAFVIIDPRQENNMFLGIDYFTEHVDAKNIIPMHMWKKYKYIREYKNSHRDRKIAECIVEIQYENQQFIFEEKEVKKDE